MTDLEVAVQLLGGETNKVIYDDVGMPSIMVRFDKGTNADVITGASENTHAAFSVDGAVHFRYDLMLPIIPHINVVQMVPSK